MNALRTEDVTSFSDAAEFTGVTSKNRAGWLGLRKTMLTASDVASVLNLDDEAPAYRRSAIAIYTEKVTDPEPDIIDLSPADFARMPPELRGAKLKQLFNDARFWGSQLEQKYLTTVAEFSGWEYREGGALLRSRKYPFLGCTLDSEIDCHDGIGWRDGEGKSTKLPKGWDEHSGALPIHVLIQVQTQLLVTGAPVAIVIALLQGGKLMQIPIEPDERFHAIVVEEAQEFMRRVAEHDPPAPDWRESSTDALRRLYPEDGGAIVDLPRECVEWTRELDTIAAQLKKLERRETEIRNLLKHKIGPASFGVLAEPVDGKEVWRWAKNKAGQRVLKRMNRAPRRARVYGLNGSPVANDPLTAALEASLEEEMETSGEPAKVIRYASPRRRSRR